MDTGFPFSYKPDGKGFAKQHEAEYGEIIYDAACCGRR